MQRMFNPVDHGFEWTDGWYKFDREAARKAALAARRRAEKALRVEGYTVSNFTLSDQLITLGGIGTVHPQIEVVVSVYGLNAREPALDIPVQPRTRGRGKLFMS